MKNKVVQYLAGEALAKLRDARCECINMKDRNPQIFSNSKNLGQGLDLQVVREALDQAEDMLQLLV